MADLIILTEEAKKIAVGEKNRPRTALSHQRFFFSKMRATTRKDCESSGAAIACLIFQPVHPAIPRAEAAGLQVQKGLFNSCGEDAIFIRLKIKRLKNFSPFPLIQEISFFCTDGEPISFPLRRASVASFPLRVKRIWVGVNPYSINPIFPRPFRHFPKSVRAF